MNRKSSKALIIKRVNFQEADRIVTLLTEDLGKFTGLAKGVRKPKSKLAGGLEIFSVNEIEFIDGKSDLRVLVGAQLKKHFQNISKDINKTMLAYKMLELVDKNTEENCSSDYYTLLTFGLESVNLDSSDIELVELWFRVKLLELGGLLIKLDSQVDDSKFEESSNYNFDYEHMGFIKDANGSFAPADIKLLKLISKVDNPTNILNVRDLDSYKTKLLEFLRTVYRTQN